MSSIDTTDESVVISSASRFEFSPGQTTLDSFELQRERTSVDCSSGESESGEWLGVRVDALLERAGPEERATHLLVTGTDGYRVCIPLMDALTALLAVSRRDAGNDESLPRLVGVDVGGTRSVKGVQRIETVTLAPGEDPSEYENLGTEESS